MLDIRPFFQLNIVCRQNLIWILYKETGSTLVWETEEEEIGTCSGWDMQNQSTRTQSLYGSRSLKNSRSITHMPDKNKGKKYK